jgi:mycothiol synthase
VPQSVATGVPDDGAREHIRRLAADVQRTDGAPPLSDQALSRLASPDVAHVTTTDGGRLVGYAQRDGSSLELVGDVDALPQLLDAVTVPGTLAWSHGKRSRLVPLLDARGYTAVRELFELRRPLGAEHPLPPDPPLADGVTVRAFEPGRDDQAWLAINAAAFAHHPEQGGWSEQDLQARIDETWFDAAGFLLAERDGTLLGFHWTKIHDDGAGEVYVLGVSPDAQGLGLGSALLVRGLRHLEQRGCPSVLLYVDGDNETAVRLYEKAGFTAYDTDVQWQLR